MSVLFLSCHGPGTLACSYSELILQLPTTDSLDIMYDYLEEARRNAPQSARAKYVLRNPRVPMNSSQC
jgi:hypothetical protein